jgi:hypothetical protein
VHRCTVPEENAGHIPTLGQPGNDGRVRRVRDVRHPKPRRPQRQKDEVVSSHDLSCPGGQGQASHLRAIAPDDERAVAFHDIGAAGLVVCPCGRAREQRAYEKRCPRDPGESPARVLRPFRTLSEIHGDA